MLKIINDIIKIENKYLDKKYEELDLLLLKSVYYYVITTNDIPKYSKDLNGAIDLICDLITPIARKNDLLGSFYYIKKIQNIEDDFTKTYEEFYSKMNGRDMDYEIYNIVCSNIFEKWKVYKKQNGNI